MHIVLLACDGRSPTEIARVLFCSRTTVYAVVARFVGDKQAAFFDRRRRGPKPLIDESANERIGRLLEEESPVEPSCWSWEEFTSSWKGRHVEIGERPFILWNYLEAIS